MIDQQVRSLVDDALTTTPTRVGNLTTVVGRGRRRRRVRRSMMVMSTVGVVGLLLAPMLWLTRVVPQPLAATPHAIELPDGLVVGVAGEPVVSEGALVYLASESHPPAFDTAKLGVEVPLAADAASELVVPPKGNPLERNALQASVLVYVGDINGAQIALQQYEGGVYGVGADDQLCVFFGNRTPITGGGICDVPSGPVVGFAADPPIGGWVVWTKLADEVSVVQLVLADGESYWQRVRGRTVFFNLPDGSRLESATLNAISADGTKIITMEPRSEIELGQ